MNALVVLLISIAVLLVGYICYGGWLAKQWGLSNEYETPAHSMEDGVDYVPSKPYVLIGHHFSSIAGAGPINGPIQAAIFGWVPVLLWVLIGGIFFGGAHDFGSLFVSIRNKGRSIAAVMEDTVGFSAKQLFCLFVFATLILCIAAFASIVANTFAVSADSLTGVFDIDSSNNLSNRRTATISVLFILVAIVWGFVTRKINMPTAVNVISSIAVISVIVAIGYLFPLISLPISTWMIIIGIYIFIASVAPVWILLQPRDYLSSYLLYGMIALAIIAIIGSSLMGATASLDIPAFTGFYASNVAVDANGVALSDAATGTTLINKSAASGFLFPALFVTIACGAISGFHSTVSSGTTSKQLYKESHAKPIAYGSMLLESLLAVISLIAVAFVWTQYRAGAFSSPTIVFAQGLSDMLGFIPGLGSETITSLSYSLLILAVSAFCLTSLDSATRIARMMLQEVFVKKGETLQSLTGTRKALANPYITTLVTVVLGVGLGMSGYEVIWPIFGAANQLIAVFALLAISAFLFTIGKRFRMLLFPMFFMLAVTFTSLLQTVISKITLLLNPSVEALAKAGGTPGVIAMTILSIALLIIAVVISVNGVKYFKKQFSSSKEVQTEA